MRIYAQGAAKAQGGAARPPEKPRGVRPDRGAPPETAYELMYLKRKSPRQVRLRKHLGGGRFTKSKEEEGLNFMKIRCTI